MDSARRRQSLTGSAKNILYRFGRFLVQDSKKVFSESVECASETFSFSRALDFLVPSGDYVLKALEEKRRLGEIGSSLEAKVIFESESARDLEYLSGLKAILPSIFIVSQIEIHQKDGIVQTNFTFGNHIISRRTLLTDI